MSANDELNAIKLGAILIGGAIMAGLAIAIYNGRKSHKNLSGADITYFFNTDPVGKNLANVGNRQLMIAEQKSSNFTGLPAGNYIWHQDTVNNEVPGTPIKGEFEKIEGKPCVPGSGIICY